MRHRAQKWAATVRQTSQDGKSINGRDATSLSEGTCLGQRSWLLVVLVESLPRLAFIDGWQD